MSERPETRVCSKCGNEKPLTVEYFKPHKNSKHGFKAHCRVCEAAYRRAYAKANPEIVSAHTKTWRESHRAEFREMRRRMYAKRSQSVDIFNDPDGSEKESA